MGQVSFSANNTSKPAPRWWRKFENGLLMILIPATVAVVMGWGFKDDAFVTKLTLIINTGLVALIKFIGQMLANGEEYAPAEAIKFGESIPGETPKTPPPGGA